MSPRVRTRAENLLERLVNSPSPTTSQSQVRKTHSILASELDSLGFHIRWQRDHSGKTDDLLIAERAGTTPDFVTLVSHVDTVLSVETTGGFKNFSGPNGERRANGAGVIDNKGGLVVLVESLRLFLESPKFKETPIGFRVVSSPDEENGSTAWHKTFQELGRTSRAVLGFEPALDDGSIIGSRRGNRWYDITIEGIEAHAGRCSGEEINAAHVAAQVVKSILERKPMGPGVAINVGHIEGGRDRHNVVCGKVIIKLDTRFSNFQERDHVHRLVAEILGSDLGRNREGAKPKALFDIVDDCQPFDVAQGSDRIVQLLCRSIEKREGRPVPVAKAGGAGDVNHMSREGLLILDGLGPVGGGMHTIGEFIDLDSIQTRAEALAEWYPKLLQQLSGQSKSQSRSTERLRSPN